MATSESERRSKSLTHNVVLLPKQSELALHQVVSSANNAVTVELANATVSSPTFNLATLNSDDLGGGEVILCNLDDLSRFIPDNFYTDVALADNDINKSTASLGDGAITIHLPTEPLPSVSVAAANKGGAPQAIRLVAASRASITDNLVTTSKACQSPLLKTSPRLSSSDAKWNSVESPRLTLLQEFPDASKVVIQEENCTMPDSITSILEEMSSSPGDVLAASGLESSDLITLTSNPSLSPSRNVQEPRPLITAKKAKLSPSPSRNSGAKKIKLESDTVPTTTELIPLQLINGHQVVSIAAVKSEPLQSRVIDLQPSPSMVADKDHVVSSVMAALNGVPKERVVKTASPSSTVTTITNKTCTWPMENGTICGKTFTKTYNLKVHQRMHLDKRPFRCSVCEQSFRQKAHLQRHETTHGIGVKVFGKRRPSRKREEVSVSSSAPTVTVVNESQAEVVGQVQLSEQLKERLNRVQLQFCRSDDQNEDNSQEEKHADLFNVVVHTVDR